MFEAYRVGVTLKLNDLITPALGQLARNIARTGTLVEHLNKRLQKLHSPGLENLAISAKTLRTGLAASNAEALALLRNIHRLNGTSIVGAAGGGRGGRFRGGDISVGASGMAVGRIGMGAGDVFPLVAGGAMAGWAGITLYRQARDYQDAQAQFASMNLGDKINQDADKTARSLRVAGVSMIQAMELLRDATVVMGNYQHAKDILPALARMQFANSVLFSGTGMDHRQYQDLLRVAEIRGAFRGPGAMTLQADYMQHVLAGTGGRVLPSEYLNFLKTGGVMAQKMSDHSFYYGLEGLIQEMGGFRTGTGMMSIYQNLALGKITTAAATELVRLGLINPGGVEFNKIGTIKRILPHSLIGEQLFEKDLPTWLKTVFLPALARKGITKEDQVLGEIAYVLSNRTGSNVMSKIYLQSEKLKKNAAIDEQAMGIGQASKKALQQSRGAEQDFQAAWKDFKIVFGQSVLPEATKLIRMTTGFIKQFTVFNQSISEFRQTHPKLTGYDTSMKQLTHLGILERVVKGAYWVDKQIFGMNASTVTGNRLVSGTIHQQPGNPVVNVYVDGQEIAHRISGPANPTGTTGLNPGVLRPMSATPGRGY